MLLKKKKNIWGLPLIQVGGAKEKGQPRAGGGGRMVDVVRHDTPRFGSMIFWFAVLGRRRWGFPVSACGQTPARLSRRNSGFGFYLVPV